MSTSSTESTGETMTITDGTHTAEVMVTPEAFMQHLRNTRERQILLAEIAEGKMRTEAAEINLMQLQHSRYHIQQEIANCEHGDTPKKPAKAKAKGPASSTAND